MFTQRNSGRSTAAFTAARHHRLVHTARGGDTVEAGQPVGHHPRTGAQVLLRPGGDFGEPEALDHGELHA